VPKAFFTRAPALVLVLRTAISWGTPDIRVGEALPIAELPAEAQQFEAALQGYQLSPAGDTVEERRHFDDRLVEVGLGAGLGMPGTVWGTYAELTPWDRLTVGLEAGLSFWGPAGGGYFRLRPIVWGGEGTKLLNAFVLQASYTVMRHGPFPFSMPCISSPCPEIGYLNRTALVGALSAGFEHQFASGWHIRYDFGIGRALFATAWKCARFDDGSAAPCQRRPPSDDVPVLSLALGHTL
jgi:hypothetical protein